MSHLTRSRRALGHGAADAHGRRPADLTDPELADLADALASGRYRPGPLRELTVQGATRARAVYVPTALDRVVVEAWRADAEPTLDARLRDLVHGFRPRRSRFTALAHLSARPVPAQAALVQLDIADMFESLPHDRLLAAARAMWGVPRGPAWWPAGPAARALWTPGGLGGRDRAPRRSWCVEVIAAWLRAWRPGGVGVPPGVAAAPALSNAFLDATLDGWLAGLVTRGRAVAAVRYADDLTVLARGDGDRVVREATGVLAAAGLRVKEEKTVVTRVEGGGWPAVVLGLEVTVDRGRLVFRDGDRG